MQHAQSFLMNLQSWKYQEILCMLHALFCWQYIVIIVKCLLEILQLKFFFNYAIGNFDIQDYNVLIILEKKIAQYWYQFFPNPSPVTNVTQNQVLAYFLDIIQTWFQVFLLFQVFIKDPVFSYFFSTTNSYFLVIFFSSYHGNKIYKSIKNVQF